MARDWATSFSRIAMVVRCFEDEMVPHVTEELDPIGDIDTVELELILSDLEIAERHLERVTTKAKGNPREYADELAVVKKAIEALRAGTPIRALDVEEPERNLLAPRQRRDAAGGRRTGGPAQGAR